MSVLPRHAKRCASTPAKRSLFIFAALCAAGWTTFAAAGGGPENVLLVVNPRSLASLTIANHYAQLRNIPDDNLLFLPWDTKNQTADVDTFRRLILVPVLRAIQDQRLADQIDYVIYSSDFPWGISLKSDVRKFAEEMKRAAPPPDKEESEKTEDKQDEKKPPPKPEWPKQLTPVGSLNGLTYLWQPVLAGSPAYFEPHSNRYMPQSAAGQNDSPTIGFRANRLFNRQGEVVRSGGQRYFLSTMLGVTAGRGNSVDEVLHYLRRSAEADGIHPKGTIYFVENDNIRSKVRHGLFPSAVRELNELGVAAEIIQGTVPPKKDDVQGVVMGTAGFDWKASGSTILPGAICEHFTSSGGVMREKAGQTPLSEFLRYGAAGASGTVTEPYAIAQKFPSPMVQVHYARGCTLAEAFYQSVSSPYQLLIVGDPLCRPWAAIPQVSVEGVKPGSVVRGRLRLKPTATLSDKAAVDRFELFVDGRRMGKCHPGGILTLNTKNLADGYHQLRVVAVGPPPIESQGRLIIPVRLSNHGRKIEASLTAKEPPSADKPIVIAARSPGAMGIIVLHGSRVVGKLAGAEGQIEIPPDTLGAGPMRLRVVGFGGGGVRTNVAAEPLEFTISIPRSPVAPLTTQ
ncbi:MAG: hypothetical protein KKE86_00720 [Planctomycetes bacterium]|nr:hypothetical protein [Planctomycetota bacterium]MBU4397833.1 hypothetical protein [Planctomycetota bacterium]MCG2683431.1 hypothetical protein [Planctomycetales bacterium]